MRQRNVPCLASRVRIGKANAAVLPVPVWAVPIKSFPERTIGKARSWIGVGSVNPIAWVPRTTSLDRPKSLNDTERIYPLLGLTSTGATGHNGRDAKCLRP